MAKIAELIGFVEGWSKDNPENPSWGMKLSEPHSKKDGEKWVTVSRTYYTIKAAYEVEIDFTQFKKGDRVRIEGTQLTEVSGEYKNLVVKATSVEVIAPRESGATSALKNIGAKPLDEAF